MFAVAFETLKDPSGISDSNYRTRDQTWEASRRETGRASEGAETPQSGTQEGVGLMLTGRGFGTAN
jgi:hypothetical protein